MVVFRVDGNEKISLGHIVRCLSIADELNRQSKECIFILADNTVQAFVKEHGYNTIALNTDFTNMDKELPSLFKELVELEPEAVIIDSYYVTYSYLQEITLKWKTIYIDDLGKFPYPVNCLINCSAYGTLMKYDKLYAANNTKLPELYLGMEYVPLRQEFRDVELNVQKHHINNVLILTGGADSFHISMQLVKYIEGHEQACKDINYHLVLGVMNFDKKEIKKKAINKSNIILHENVKDMKKLMTSCDIAVSAGGTTLYELCACGLPTITYVVADNQLDNVQAFNQLGVMEYLGDVRYIDDISKTMVDAVDELDKDYNKRLDMARKMKNFVDGYGVERIIKNVIF